MRAGVWTSVLAVVVLAACSSGSADDGARPVAPSATLPPVTAAPEVVPGEDWQREDAGDFGPLDADLEASRSTCLAVVRDGVLVHTATWGGADERTARAAYSITKSVTAVLVGMAVDDGDLALDDAVSTYVPQWRGTPSADVTVRDLMAGVSGRQWTYDLDYGQMIRRAPDKTAFSVGLGQDVPPGERWQYDNSAVQVLEAVLTGATGTEVRDLADERLFGPLGMRDTTWATDAAGSTTTYSGIDSTCPDLARLGLLLARDGRWGEDQLVPAAFVREATGRSSQDLNAAYGLLWWVNQPGRVQTIERASGFAADEPPFEGRLAPSAPADTFWALGYGNELLAVVPSREVVAVRMGSRPAAPGDLTFDSFTGGVLDALG